MNKATAALLSSDEQTLVRATEPKRLKGLNEDELIDLHTLVRRGRNKYSKLHRRQSAAQVSTDRARGMASKKNLRTAQKAEIFEEALGRVSAKLAKASRQTAAELKAQRLAAASKATPDGAARPSQGSGAGPVATPTKSSGKADQRTPVSKKKRASTKAEGKRAQAKRDKG